MEQQTHCKLKHSLALCNEFQSKFYKPSYIPSFHLNAKSAMPNQLTHVVSQCAASEWHFSVKKYAVLFAHHALYMPKTRPNELLSMTQVTKQIGHINEHKQFPTNQNPMILYNNQLYWTFAG